MRNITHFPPSDLGNGLVVRPSTQQDSESLLQLVETVFESMLVEGNETHMVHLARRIMSGNHPTLGPEDFTLVEDTSRAKQRIVGCTGLLRHTWEYDGIPIAVGRPEIIATYPEFRRQGLIRSLFTMMHARSAARADLMQAITGIPYFYRQFDYEYALDLWDTIHVEIANIPQQADQLTREWALRDATLADIPLLQELYASQRRKGMVSLPVDEQWWRYQIQTWRNDPAQDVNSHVLVLVDPEQNAQGYALTSVPQSRQYMQIWDLEVTNQVDLQETMPAILRALQQAGEKERDLLPAESNLSEMRFKLLHSHSAFAVLSKFASDEKQPTFAWYIRVGDLPRFLVQIAPVLASRLTEANKEHFYGELKLDFYRSGLRLVFEQGCLTKAEPWQQGNTYQKADAGFPPNVFLQMLFGRRSLAELRFIFPDVWVKSEEIETLLKILFPTRPSWVLPLW